MEEKKSLGSSNLMVQAHRIQLVQGYQSSHQGEERLHCFSIWPLNAPIIMLSMKPW